MRIESVAALLVCLCLWIPAAQSQYSATPPEDEESSGDDLEISGSGSGDDDPVMVTDFTATEVATQAITNTTKTAWVTDAPVRVPEQTVTQLPSTVIPLADVETAGPTTVAPLVHTTKIPETPSSTSVESLIRVKEVFDAETTTVHHVDQGDATTALPDEKLPATTERSTTTAVDSEEEIIASVMPDMEDGETTVLVKDYDQSTDAPEMETTPLPMTTLPAKEVADPEASGDIVVSTTIQTTIGDGPNDLDFEFINEDKSRSVETAPDSDVSRGADDRSLMERTEVLAGVIAGGLVGLAFAIMLVALMVYRMKKKDEGSYSLDEHKHPNGGYQKPKAQEEFLA